MSNLAQSQPRKGSMNLSVQNHRGSKSTVILPKVHDSEAATPKNLVPELSQVSFKMQGFRTQENFGAKSSLDPVLYSPATSMSRVQSKHWKDKFKLLEVRQEYLQASQSARMTQTLMKSISPKHLSREVVKESISTWGKDGSQFNSARPYLTDKEAVIEFRNHERERKEEEKLEQELLNKMNDSFETELDDAKQQNRIGVSAPENYYKHFKKLERVNQQNKHYQLPDSPFTSVLRAAQSQNVIPCKLGLVKTNGTSEDLYIKNMKYGDQYVKVISEGMSKVKSIQNFYLSGNRITNKGADLLLKNVLNNARVLELGENQIGIIGCQHLALGLHDRDSKIEILNLEGNKLGDSSIALILEALDKNKTLTLLNLSRNYLTDRSAEKMATILEGNYTLKELYLYWNQIKAAGGASIFSSLAENDTLRVLDISSNSLGSGGINQTTAFTDQFCRFLVTNVELRHLDVSNNLLKLDSVKKIQESLSKNKSIYGFHFSGNAAGYVDSRGFLVVEDQFHTGENDLTGIHIKKRINGCKSLSHTALRNERDDDLRDFCWICDGWNEETISWDQEKSGVGNPDPLFVHFNFEGYQSNYYGKQQGPSFTYKRMFPPGHLLYFHTLEDTHNFDNREKSKIIPNPEGFKIQEVKMFDGSKIDVEIDSVNLIEIKMNKSVIDENYHPTISVLPRTKDHEYVPEKQKKQRVKWTFPISIFFKWRPDDEEILKKCFEVDWENCKISSKIKKQEDQDLVKEFLRSKYKHIKEAYKQFGSIAPIQDVWCIQNVAWLELIQIMNVIDSKVTAADINLKWTSTISGGEKGNYRNPERGINRHQLMEALVRIAEEKYILKYQKTQQFYEAITMFWEEHLEQIFVEKYNQQKWRSEQYWVEDVDLCLKNYKKIIENVYKKYAKQKVKPGQAPFMCLDELIRIVQIAGLMEDEKFGSGVPYMAYNFAMMTQIDELQSDRIFQMSLLEFYEALTRIAEEASLPVFTGIVEADFEWTWEKRRSQPLAHKLEGLIIRLLDNVCDAAFKATIPKIEKSFFVKIDDSDEFE